MKSIFEQEVDNLGLVLSKKQKEQFDQYYNLLIEWNKVMNLTAITDYDQVNLKHFTDSLTIVKVISMEKMENMIDVGTGAGFPGIPIKIMFPHLKVVLLDSLNKRVKFLNTVIEELGLKDISAVHGRAEDIGKNKLYREKFDLCVSRAVANLSTLCEYCLPFVGITGSFVSYKSADLEEEIKNAEGAVKILGGKIDGIEKFTLPETEIGRALVKIVKIKYWKTLPGSRKIV